MESKENPAQQFFQNITLRSIIVGLICSFVIAETSCPPVQARRCAGDFPS